MITPLYRLRGWNQHVESLGSCIFNVYLDAEFARKCLNFKPIPENISRFKSNAKLSLHDTDIMVSFFDNSFLPRSMAVSGNCCCLGIDGNDHNSDHWYKSVEYHGHNIDTRHQAYGLLSLFCYWVDCAEALVIPMSSGPVKG